MTLHPFSRIAICVPSPQSTRRLLPSSLVIMAVSHLPGSGIIPLVPNKHTSNIIHLFPSLNESVDYCITIPLLLSPPAEQQISSPWHRNSPRITGKNGSVHLFSKNIPIASFLQRRLLSIFRFPILKCGRIYCSISFSLPSDPSPVFCSKASISRSTGSV